MGNNEVLNGNGVIVFGAYDHEGYEKQRKWDEISNEYADRLAYPTIHIKDEELTDDEYIDVVSYFESDFQKEKNNIEILKQSNEGSIVSHSPTNVYSDDDLSKSEVLSVDECGKEEDEKIETTPDDQYTLLKQQLAKEPLGKQMVMSRNLNNQIEKQLSQSSAKLIKQKYLAKYHETTPDVKEIFFTTDCCRFDPEEQEFVIHNELSGSSEVVRSYSMDDLTLRYRVVVFLWILLGERRLFQVGFPTASIHVTLWRVVHICCSVAGVKSAAAVPLPDNHDCGTDMLCFRDHVHRFLEICAPTRDHWKQFGWASLTVDAVVAKIYKQELLPTLLHHTIAIPVPIKMAMCKLDNLDKIANAVEHNGRLAARWRLPRPSTPSLARMYGNSPGFRPILPKPPVGEKKKRGRPVKINRVTPDTGKIERVMLWRFVLNLLEEPGNAACIHWLNRDEGIFRILNTDWLARIWGRRHGNPRMTYEKMARAMRTYYRSKVLQPVPRNRNLPRKLVYRFNPALVRRVTAK